MQVVLDEVAGRQVAVNNRAGRSNGQVEVLLGHVDALLAGNGNTLFTPSDEPAPVIQPARYTLCSLRCMPLPNFVLKHMVVGTR